MSAQAQPRLSPDEYLELDRATEFKHEYFDGRIYMMPGGSYAHALVITNLGGELRSALKKRPCTVTTTEARTRVSEEGLYTYPDVAVVCGEPQFRDKRKDTILNPVLIIEVLSPSTEAYDRGFKFAQYRKLETLEEYVLVSQSEPHVEVFRRQHSGDWLLSEWSGMDATCRFSSLDCSVALAEIYDKVTFTPEETGHPSPGL